MQPPASAAQSNSRVSANAPRGASLNSSGRNKAAPANTNGAEGGFGAPLQAALGVHVVVAAPGIADAAGRRRQQQQRIHVGRVERLCQPLEIGLHAVDPERVGVNVNERLAAESVKRLDHAAAGCRAAPTASFGDHDARFFAIGEVALDLSAR